MLYILHSRNNTRKEKKTYKEHFSLHHHMFRPWKLMLLLYVSVQDEFNELMKQEGNLPEWQIRNLVHRFPNLRKSPLQLGLARDEEDEVDSDRHGQRCWEMTLGAGRAPRRSQRA